MRGTLYGIGVGPGDPELLTLRAVRAIKECGIIAMSDSGAQRRAAFDIAKEYLDSKEILSLDMPMTRDLTELNSKRAQAAETICAKLDSGKDVGFLTLGDPFVYSTYSYVHKLVTDKGYEATVIPGITSFCAAAAGLQKPLCEAGEALHIIPASYGDINEALNFPGTKVLMKSGKKLNEVLKSVSDKNLTAYVAENVGMPGERLIFDIAKCAKENFDAGYFSIVVVK
ncbi:MAG: precorrin-2 C(20)-methyltransferase [Clostridiales bacterium]|jgi:precorrin-2/cobalt-factor-2 C20-methyltransferase|nr:precorrin-2 C(20)-methyltransferase [Clostridiales bacterium]